jgi:hypothetical protein
MPSRLFVGPGTKGINKQNVKQEFNNTFSFFLSLTPLCFFVFFNFPVMAFASGGDHGTKCNHNTYLAQ